MRIRLCRHKGSTLALRLVLDVESLCSRRPRDQRRLTVEFEGVAMLGVLV